MSKNPFLKITFLLLFCICGVTSCTTEEAESSNDKGILRLKAEVFNSVDTQRQAVSEVPPCSEAEATYAMVVLTGPENVGSLASPEKVEFNSSTGETAALRLSEGNYQLEYFAIYDAGDNMIWFAPTETEFSEFVSNPLPAGISISNYESSSLAVDIVCYEERRLKSEPLIGFNMRWRDTPELSEELYSKVSQLNPDLLRYPGGTLAHKWNWRTGYPEPSNSEDVQHLIGDVKLLADNTGSEIIFVVDIVNSTVEDQIEMINAANVPVKYIEIGNELYADDYETGFPSGSAYASVVNEWVPQLEAEFPNAEFGAVMLGRNAGNDRKNNWNIEVHNNISVDVDAYIYHIYTNETESVADRIVRFEEAFLTDTGKDLWITEYGVRSGLLEDTTELADYVESIADIALNHVLISRSGNFTKLTESLEFTDEGLLFFERNNP